MSTKNESKSKRIIERAKLIEFVGFAYLMGGIVLAGLSLSPNLPLQNARAALFFSIFLAAFSFLSFVEYLRAYVLAAKEQLREYLDTRLNEIAAEIRRLREGQS
jgi:hypothetical protein